MDANANTDAGGSTIALRELRSGKLKNDCAPSKDSDKTGRMPRPSFRFAHMPFCWFCHEAAQMLVF